jgi:hypothetical protein
MMKPKSQGPHDEGLLEYLEDIIGSNRHVERIEEGAKKCALAHTSLVSRFSRTCTHTRALSRIAPAR